ncbi:MAG: glutathione S-transferase [Pseudomonadales bacterium]|nr:glutathione S-transferase [Pseudomonadales bacterium]
MLKIYHVPRTRSVRVIWLCEELGIPYEVESISFDPEFRASPEWRKMNPVGKVPVLTDGDLTMFESGAMVQYILDRYGNGKLQPAIGTPEHALYLQWSWFAEATFARPLGEIVSHGRAFAKTGVIPEVVAELQDRSHLCLQAIDQAVQNKDFLLGEFSAADIMMGYTVMLTEMLAPSDNCPNASAYWARLQERQACQKAIGYGLK